MAVDTKSELVVDRSAHGELLRINFNISFPALSCEFATLDVSDALGTVRRAHIDTASERSRLLAQHTVSPHAVLAQSFHVCSLGHDPADHLTSPVGSQRSK